MNGPSKEDEKRWKAEADLRTLVEAQRIRSDKGRSAAAQKIADEQSQAMKKEKPNGR